MLLMAGMQGIPRRALRGRRGRRRVLVAEGAADHAAAAAQDIALSLIISVIGSFLAFNQFYILTEGGPGTSTQPVVMWIYQEAFAQYHLGYATAGASRWSSSSGSSARPVPRPAATTTARLDDRGRRRATGGTRGHPAGGGLGRREAGSGRAPGSASPVYLRPSARSRRWSSCCRSPGRSLRSFMPDSLVTEAPAAADFTHLTTANYRAVLVQANDILRYVAQQPARRGAAPALLTAVVATHGRLRLREVPVPRLGPRVRARPGHADDPVPGGADAAVPRAALPRA